MRPVLIFSSQSWDQRTLDCCASCCQKHNDLQCSSIRPRQPGQKRLYTTYERQQVASAVCRFRSLRRPQLAKSTTHSQVLRAITWTLYSSYLMHSTSAGEFSLPCSWPVTRYLRSLGRGNTSRLAAS